MKYIIMHYEEFIAILGSLTGILSIFYTFYSKKRDSDLKEKQFQLDRKYKISKEKYQELMEEKISLYMQLHSIYLRYIKESHSIGKIQYDINDEKELEYKEVTVEKVFNDTFLNIKNLIENNIFLISNNLEKIFLSMAESYESYYNEFRNKLDYNVIDEYNKEEERQKLINEFYFKNKDNLNLFWQQLEQEIKEMKSKLD